VRFFAGEVVDAYLVRADIQRGLSIVVWRGRHVAEPTDRAEPAPSVHDQRFQGELLEELARVTGTRLAALEV
jgi:hypothetical protein